MPKGKPKKGRSLWLVGIDGKKFRRRKGESVAEAQERQTRHLKKAQIIELIEKGWSIRRACAKAGYHHSTIYRWMEDDQDFARELYAAEAGALGAVEEAGFMAAKTPEGVQDRKLIMRARGGYAFELPEPRKSDDAEEDPRDIEVELVDGDGNPLFEA